MIKVFKKVVGNMFTASGAVMSAFTLGAFIYFSIMGNRPFMHPDYAVFLLFSYIFLTMPFFINYMLGHGFSFWNKLNK